VTPGPLWWGFDWQSADDHARTYALPRKQTIPPADANNGCVVLIDEIDKADSDVPNGLLEALGAGEFTPEGCERVQVGHRTPLVIVTTNEERALPDAFVRRCLVLRLDVPTGDSLKQYLIERGRAHFRRIDERDDAFAGREIDESLLGMAAEMLVADRNAGMTPLPGLAEYLDLLRAVRELADDGVGTAADLLNSVRRFTLRKHSETSR
jgi:MoxR-like ATPase